MAKTETLEEVLEEEVEESHEGRPSWLRWLVAAIGVVGLFDATLLTVEHYTNRNLPCTITHGCETVLTSKYASVGPIPTAAFGIVFYGLIVFAAVYALSNAIDMPRRLLALWTAIGFASSLGLLYLQGFVIHAWCQYCLLSALSSTLLFVVAIFYFTQKEA